MKLLLFLDQQSFFFLNHLPHNWLFDFVAVALSGVGKAGIIWFILGFLLFLREEKKNHWFFAPLVLAGISSWLLAEQILKPIIARERPIAQMGAIVLGSNISDSFSFPSGHATIAFAAATVLSKLEYRWRWLFYILAVLIAFSRIYVGKHYPLDVIAGSILGLIIGNLSILITKKMTKPFKLKEKIYD